VVCDAHRRHDRPTRQRAARADARLAVRVHHEHDPRQSSATFTEANFEDPTKTTYLSVGAVGAPGSVMVAHITGALTFNTLHFAPQLVDGVGNALPIVDSTLDVSLSKETIAAPSLLTNSSAYTAQFGSVLAMGGDVDGDKKPDFAVAAPYATVPDPTDPTKTISNAGAVTVFFGGTWPLKSQTIMGTSNAYLGRTLELADLNGDNLADLAVRSGGNTIQVYLSNGTSSPFSSTPSFSLRIPAARLSAKSRPSTSAATSPSARGPLGQ